MLYMRSLLIAAVALSTVGRAASHFPLFWNVDEGQAPPVNVTQYDFLPRNYTQVGNGCSNPLCRSWTQGEFARIDAHGNKINGGVPQSGNLTHHLQAFASGVKDWIPDPDWSGNAVLDFEAWTPVWEENTSPDSWHSRVYQNESIRLVKARHPEWTHDQIEVLAKQEFESAATEWFVRSLELGRSLRPKAKWGFYGRPANNLGDCVGNGTNLRCSYDGPAGNRLREFSDRQSAVWNASTALYPSIYLPVDVKGKPYVAAAYVRAVVSEGRRIAANIPVLPYAWHYYHDGQTLLPTDEVVSVLKNSLDRGADGLVIWGGDHLASSYWSWLRSEGGPVTKTFCETAVPGGACLL